MEAQLKRLGPNPKTKILKVLDSEPTKIWLAGRGTSCQIYTKSKYASRKHFVITYRDKKYFISDLQSANGTFLNDEKLTCEKVLTFGCVISVGVPSKMKNEPECIVFVFEPLSVKEPSCIENTITIDDDDIQIIETVTKNPVKNQVVNIKQEKNNLDENVQNAENKKPNSLSHILEKELENFDNILQPSKSKDNEETIIHTSRSDIVNRSKPSLVQKRPRESDDSDCEIKEVKIMKLSEPKLKNSNHASNNLSIDSNPNIVNIKTEHEKNQSLIDDADDDDDNAYEALTLLDESNIKPEPNLLNYSVTEELIELSDSDEEDWSVKNNELSLCEEEKEKSLTEDKEENEEEDDDVIFLECISTSRVKRHDIPPVLCKIEDDMTEADKKWMDKLFKLKQEFDICSSQKDQIQSIDISEDQPESSNTIKDILAILEEGLNLDEAPPDQTDQVDQNVVPSPPKVVSEDESQVPEHQEMEEEHQESLPVEKPSEVTKKSGPKKSVKFDLVPKVIYFEAPQKVKATPLQKGEMRFVRIIFNICSWNTSWLEECKRVASDKDPPDLCSEPLRKIPRKFITHSDYTSAFVPVMLLGLWNKVKEHWKKFGDSTFRQTVSCDDYEDHSVENLSICKCTGLVQSVEGHKHLIREGHLVMLRLHQVQNSKCAPQALKYSKKLGYLVFGFIESKTYERFDSQPLHNALRERCASTHGDLHLVKFTILIKKRPSLVIDKKKLIQVTVVHSISPDMRMFRAVCLLPQSPLSKAILRPSRINFKCDEPEDKEVYFKGSLDALQKEIVSKFARACTSKDFFMYSVHGSAGTGKGHLILALILELLYGSESRKSGRHKIIFCSSSSGTLDQMVKRLKRCRDDIGYGEYSYHCPLVFKLLYYPKPENLFTYVCFVVVDSLKFSMVRVGHVKEVDPEIEEFYLANLAAKYSSGQTILANQKIDAEVQVLKQSDVICCTCFSTGINKMVWALERNFCQSTGQKIICIIDEAVRIREPDSLLPLLLGVTHLFLFGDVFQNDSSFASEKTHRLGLNVSLFERIYKNVSNRAEDLPPIYFLKTQYRMNPGLSRFTTKIVYNIQLLNSTVNAFNKIDNLRSYLFLVDQPPAELSEAGRQNREGQIAGQLIKAISKIAQKPLNFAVIACDAKQVEVLRSILPQNKFPEVEVDHFQKFQGRETDVSIFIFNSILIQSQLAIAVTRAKSCLVILTSKPLVTNNVWLQKFSDHANAKKASVCIQSIGTPETFERFLKEPLS